MINTLPEQNKRYALVIGVNDYDDPRIGDLNGANRDARALAEALQQYAGFPHEQIFLLTTDQFDKDQRPTRGNILRRLDTLVDTVPEDGLLLVSFAGHGIEREEKPFLLPTDAPYTPNVNLLEDMAVSVARLKEYIKQTRVGQVIILLDACRNLPGTSRGISPNPLTEAYRRGFKFDVRNHEVQAFATLYATAVGEYALEDIARNRGYFTTAVVEAMAGAAANERGEVTLNALVKYVQEQVPRRVKLMGGGHEQKPFADVEGFKADDLVIAAVEPRAVTVAVSPPSDTEHLFWTSIQNSNDSKDYEEYLTRWPHGDFAGLARRRREAISRAEATPLAEEQRQQEERQAQEQARQRELEGERRRQLEAQRQEELSRQREQHAQREREQEAQHQRELEKQRRAEASGLAEEKRKQEEKRQLNEQASQRELEAERQQQLEVQRLRQQEAQQQHASEEKRRAEAAPSPIKTQLERPGKELEPRPPIIPTRSPRSLIGVGVGLILLALTGWLVWRSSNIADQTSQSGQMTPTGSISADSSPTPTPARIPIEVMRYRQEFDRGIPSEGWRLYFTPRKDGRLYLVAGDANKQEAKSVFLPGAQLSANMEYQFPAGARNWIDSGGQAVTFTVIFAPKLPAGYEFLSRKNYSLTEAEIKLLDGLISRSQAKTENGKIVTAFALEMPVALKLEVSSKPRGN